MTRMRNVGRRAAPALLLAAALAPGLSAQTVLLDDGPAPQLMLIYTGDVIGHLEPCG